MVLMPISAKRSNINIKEAGSARFLYKEDSVTRLSWDNKLNISTFTTRDWKENVPDFYRLEPTDYRILERIMNEIDIKASDRFVDFGCGNGRIIYYVNYRFNIPVAGIELNQETFKELEENKKSYLQEHPRDTKDIDLYHIGAEHYNIQEADTLFYFFNPFSIKIFRKVCYNIVRSVQIHERAVQIILYYPQKRFIDLLDNHTPFEMKQRIPVDWSYDDRDYAIVYHYQPQKKGE